MKREADARPDHHLLTAEVQMKLKRCNNPCDNRVKFNIQLFQDIGTTELYQTTLQNRFQALQEEDKTPAEERWKCLKNIWKETCSEVLGRKKTNHKPWLSTETMKRIEERRVKKDRKKQMQNKSTKGSSAKHDKRNYIKDLAQKAEDAASKNNLKNLYLTTKKLAGRFRRTNTQIRNIQGQLLTTKEEQQKRWTEHFRELLNRQQAPCPDGRDSTSCPVAGGRL